jgi:hypothetical protein
MTYRELGSICKRVGQHTDMLAMLDLPTDAELKERLLREIREDLVKLKPVIEEL